MKKLDIKQLDKKDEEIVEALISLGMNRLVARVLAYLQQVNEVTSNELELGTNLRQPEVSIAMRQLKEHDWINERDEKKPGKGRPYKTSHNAPIFQPQRFHPLHIPAHRLHTHQKRW